MALLTEKGRQRYALATGKQWIGICDRKLCRKLIAATDLYTVITWTSKKLPNGMAVQIPEKMMCKDCQSRLHPIPVVKQKDQGLSKGLKSSFTKFFMQHPDIGYTTTWFVKKMQHKTKFSNLKHREIVKVLKALKKDKVLLYQKKVWKLKKKKIV